MKRNGHAAPPPVPRAPLPFNLPSLRREAGAGGGIAGAGAKWASPRADDDDDRDRPAAAWGGKGVRAKKTGEFPELGDRARLSSDALTFVPSGDARAPAQSGDARAPVALGDARGRGGQTAPVTPVAPGAPGAAVAPGIPGTPVAPSTPSAPGAPTEPAVPAAKPMVPAVAEEDDDDGDWAEEGSEAMDFSHPLALPEVTLPDPLPLSPPSAPAVESVRAGHQRPRMMKEHQPPAAHWGAALRLQESGGHQGPASVYSRNAGVPTPHHHQRRAPERRPQQHHSQQHQQPLVDLRVVEEQSDIMKSKAISAAQARRRAEEVRLHAQRERSARKLRELEARLGVDPSDAASGRAKAKDTGGKPVSSGASASAVTQLAPHASPALMADQPPPAWTSPVTPGSGGSPNASSVTPRVLLRRPKDLSADAGPATQSQQSAGEWRGGGGGRTRNDQEQVHVGDVIVNGQEQQAAVTQPRGSSNATGESQQAASGRGRRRAETAAQDSRVDSSRRDSGRERRPPRRGNAVDSHVQTSTSEGETRTAQPPHQVGNGKHQQVWRETRSGGKPSRDAQAGSVASSLPAYSQTSTTSLPDSAWNNTQHTTPPHPQPTRLAPWAKSDSIAPPGSAPARMVAGGDGTGPAGRGSMQRSQVTVLANPIASIVRNQDAANATVASGQSSSELAPRKKAPRKRGGRVERAKRERREAALAERAAAKTAADSAAAAVSGAMSSSTATSASSTAPANAVSTSVSTLLPSAPRTTALSNDDSSAAWSSSNRAGPPTSFDAISRAFANQPAAFPLVGTPLLPVIPVIPGNGVPGPCPFEVAQKSWNLGDSWPATNTPMPPSEWWPVSSSAETSDGGNPSPNATSGGGVAPSSTRSQTGAPTASIARAAPTAPIRDSVAPAKTSEETAGKCAAVPTVGPPTRKAKSRRTQQKATRRPKVVTNVGSAQISPGAVAMSAGASDMGQSAGMEPVLETAGDVRQNKSQSGDSPANEALSKILPAASEQLMRLSPTESVSHTSVPAAVTAVHPVSSPVQAAVPEASGKGEVRAVHVARAAPEAHTAPTVNAEHTDIAASGALPVAAVVAGSQGQTGSDGFGGARGRTRSRVRGGQRNRKKRTTREGNAVPGNIAGSSEHRSSTVAFTESGSDVLRPAVATVVPVAASAAASGSAPAVAPVTASTQDNTSPAIDKATNGPVIISGTDIHDSESSGNVIAGQTISSDRLNSTEGRRGRNKPGGGSRGSRGSRGGSRRGKGGKSPAGAAGGNAATATG